MFTVDLRPAKDALSARIAALRSELMQVVTMQHRDELDKQVSRHAKPNILWVLGRATAGLMSRTLPAPAQSSHMWTEIGNRRILPE